MSIIVVGAGRLAKELLSTFRRDATMDVVEWAEAAKDGAGSIVIHAGSGRELEDVIAFCERTASTLVELSTGSVISDREVSFPVVLCPNTNILILKFMAMLAGSGHRFKDYKIRVTESHQAEKTSTPGTAVSLAHSLGVRDDEIRSIRDPREQTEALGIPQEYLSRHAYHRIEIEDGLTSLALETRVFGKAPYAEGMAKIVAAIRAHKLEPRLHHVLEFVENGWL